MSLQANRMRSWRSERPAGMGVKPGPVGHASLGVEVVSGQSAVISASARSPMKLLTPRPRGPSVWAYLSNFGGGLVAGDETRLDLCLGRGSRCFVGTQSSTKIYRNPGLRPCGHTTGAVLGAGSVLVLMPDPVQAFEGSAYSQHQTFELAPGAGLVLVDWLSCGRAARGERWAFRRFQSRNEVWFPADAERIRQGPRLDDPHSRTPPFPDPSENSPPHAGVAPELELGFLDSMVLDPDDGALDGPHRLGRFDCLASLLLIGPPLAEAARRLLEDTDARPIDHRGGLARSASPARDGALLRVAGECVELVSRELRRHLGFLPGLLGDDPSARKW